MTNSSRLDDIVEKEEFTQGFNRRLYDFFYTMAEAHFQGTSCLEVGPAEGYSIPRLLERFQSLTVVEGSAVLCRRLAEQYSEARMQIIHTAIEAFSPSSRFDTIILGHVLEYVEDPVLVLAKTAGWFSPNGVMILGYTNAESLHRQAAVLMGLLQSEEELSPLTRKLGVQRIYRPQAMREQIERAGLEIVYEGGFFLKPVSNQQIEVSWNEAMIAAFFELGKRFPDLAAEKIFACRAPAVTSGST